MSDQKRAMRQIGSEICEIQTSQTASRDYDIRIDGLNGLVGHPASNEDIALQPVGCSALVRLTLLAASMLAASRAVAQEASIHGVVYADANANGTRDASEHGVLGVIVSNQRDVVVTDSLGRFEIPTGTTGIVFVSVPDGFRSSGAFWRATTAAPASVDFGLVRQAQSRTFSFVHASDSHIAPENVDRFRRFRGMADSLRPAFVLMGGDLVRDAMSQSEANARAYFDLFAAEAKSFHTPMWTIPGNHDHYGIIRSRSHADPANPLYNRGMYRQYFGPDYYSFTYGGIHFIGLNTISPDDSAYYGDVDSVQMEWLKRDLARYPHTAPIIVFTHRPLFDLRPDWEWFTRDGDEWQAARDLQALCRFEVGDLLRVQPRREAYDLVLCRNTVIYFTEDVRDALHERLVASIRPGGYFVIGSTERVSRPRELGLVPTHPFTYRKA